MRSRSTISVWGQGVGINYHIGMMESLGSIEAYIEGLHPGGFSTFFDICNRLYENWTDVRRRVEFSAVLTSSEASDLRFGLFKLFVPQKVADILRDSNPRVSNIGGILSCVLEFVPELGIGFDWNLKDPRAKMYFLRLPDHPRFRANPRRRINDFLNATGVNVAQADLLELDACYLLGIDFHRSERRSIKIYTREEKVDLGRMHTYLEHRGISSKYLRQFFALTSQGVLKDTTVSKKYSNTRSGMVGLSVFFETTEGSNEQVEECIRTCVPERTAEFKRRIHCLETHAPVEYSHIGLTFSHGTEAVCVYFSPVLKEV